MNILLLDIDGVLATSCIKSAFWKPAVGNFLDWAESRFDLVMILSAWRQAIHRKMRQGILFDFPSMAWDDCKLEGLGHLARKKHNVIWVEDGPLPVEKALAKKYGFILLDVPSNIKLVDLRTDLEWRIGKTKEISRRRLVSNVAIGQL